MPPRALQSLDLIAELSKAGSMDSCAPPCSVSTTVIPYPRRDIVASKVLRELALIPATQPPPEHMSTSGSGASPNPLLVEIATQAPPTPEPQRPQFQVEPCRPEERLPVQGIEPLREDLSMVMRQMRRLLGQLPRASGSVQGGVPPEYVQ